MTNLYPISISNLQDSSLISEVKTKKIAIEKGENWGEIKYGTNKRYYDIYWGPVEKDDDDCVSDYIFLEDNWFEEILNKLLISEYSINDSENHHTLYFSSDEEANTKFKEIISLLKSIGFKIVRDCY
jgi:hypothetical protein